MTEEELEMLTKEWIQESKDTNEYCERSLAVAALKALEEGKIEEGIGRLREMMALPPGANYILVDPPDFMVKHEENKKEDNM